MDHVGIDLQKNQSQICLITEAGAEREKRGDSPA